jgi:hypothetical protein
MEKTKKPTLPRGRFGVAGNASNEVLGFGENSINSSSLFVHNSQENEYETTKPAPSFKGELLSRNGEAKINVL